MAKVLKCKDVGMDCDFVARGETEEEDKIDEYNN